MTYIVKLHSNNDVLSTISFDTELEAFLYIRRVIISALFPIRTQVEKKYLIENNTEILIAIIYNLYQCE